MTIFNLKRLRTRIIHFLVFSRRIPGFLSALLIQTPGILLMAKVDRKQKLITQFNSKLRINYSRDSRLTYYIDGIELRFSQLIKEYCITEDVLQSIDPNGLVVDCGANIGEFSLALNYFNNNQNFICFEPDPIEFNVLKKNLNRHNATLICAPLSDKSKAVRFGLLNDTGDSTILNSEDPSIQYLELQATTLDSELSQFRKIELLKLEAEGHEPEILRGALKTLSLIKFIAVDAGFEREGKSTFHEVTTILIHNDFELIDFSTPRYTLLFKNKKVKK
jgi:FkbM family methyltransferase